MSHLSAPRHDESSEYRIEPGQVICLRCTFTTPPKEKYLVVAALDRSVLVLVINSRIAAFVQKRPWLRQCQVPICASAYTFLDHDSFIDCAEVHLIDRRDIDEQLQPDPGRFKDWLTESTRLEIVRVVEKATTISKRHKDLIVAALGEI